MADQLITGTTLIEKTSRNAGDISVGGIIEFDDTYANIPDGFLACDGSTINDPLSSYNGVALPDLNTNYISIPGNCFQSENSTEEYNYMNDAGTIMWAATQNFLASLQLPNGAVITACEVYGGATTGSWEWHLYRKVLADAAAGGDVATMGTASMGTADTSISNATIDNSTYSYLIFIDGTSATAEPWIIGAKITYTPRYKFIIRIK